MHVGWSALPAIVLAMGCAAPSSPPSPSPSQPPGGPLPSQPVRVLLLTATADFRHDSIATAVQVMTDLATPTGMAVTATENLSDISAQRLQGVNVLMFALTSGELALDDGQRRAIADFVNGGGGFIGVHSAADTLYDWPEYGRLVGAYFKEHPWTQPATVVVEDRAHAIAAGLGASFTLMEEFYTFRDNPRSSVHVLLSLDAASVSAQGDYPLAWTQSIGRGRSYYNALGHFDTTWRNPQFQSQLIAAVRWVSGKS